VKLSVAFCAALCGLSVSSTWAQTAPSASGAAAATTVVANPAERAPVAANIEGTVVMTRGGVQTRASLKFQAPDRLAVHIQGDEAKLVADEVYLAQGESQLTYNDFTRRVRRWKWSSAQQPWRSQALADGGPANLWLWGWHPAQAAKYYAVSSSQSGDITTVKLLAKKSGQRLIVRLVTHWRTRRPLVLRRLQAPGLRLARARHSSFE
jgi:hypothetical protein